MFSIIICTYNPIADALEKCLVSCLNQKYSHEYEVIVIDNNSDPPVSELTQLQTRLKNNKVTLLRETRQGLVYGRLRGIKAASADTIVFADDDNVLSENYLAVLAELRDKYPQVGAWGPGCIDLDFEAGAPAWIKKHFTAAYQQKNNKLTRYGCVVGWPDYYPAGSGLSVKKEVLEDYATQFLSGKISAKGRTGTALVSGEDSQIVWTAVKMGLSAGTSPDLKLLHLIPAKRTTRKYLVELYYGLGHSYYRALQEMFPAVSNKVKKRSIPGRIAFVLKTLVRSGFKPLLFYRLYTIENSWFRGAEA